MALTEVQIKNAKPREKAYKLADGEGLYLLVTPEGKKYWRLKYRFAGKEKLLAIGVYPETKAAQAREERDRAKEKIKQGLDPVAVKKQQRLELETASVNTFESVTREWVENQRNKWTEGHADETLKSFQRTLFNTIGARPIKSILAPELLAALRAVEASGALHTAARMLQRSGSVFRYAIATGRCERNPAADLRGALKAPEYKHYAALSEKELPEFLRKVEGYEGRAITKIALKLLALTFVRTGELRASEWPEFDFEKAEWRIPCERMKNGEIHIVPLSHQAIELLKQLQTITGNRKYLFPNDHNLTRPMSENAVLSALYRMGYKSRATGHGFRSTASTILNEQGWNPDAVERQLAHVEKNKTRAAYNRSQYMEERKRMMQAWADYLDGLRHGTNIVPIGSRVA